MERLAGPGDVEWAHSNVSPMLVTASVADDDYEIGCSLPPAPAMQPGNVAKTQLREIITTFRQWKVEKTRSLAKTLLWVSGAIGACIVMPKKPLGIRAKKLEGNDQTKFACLVAAILTSSVLEADSISLDKVFKVYGNMIRMIEKQPLNS